VIAPAPVIAPALVIAPAPVIAPAIGWQTPSAHAASSNALIEHASGDIALASGFAIVLHCLPGSRRLELRIE